MINTIFYFVDDETFDYNTALQQETISPYTIVFNKFDKTIKMGGVSYGQMNRTDVVASLGNISDILPVATSVALGAIKIGYTSNVGAQNRNYGVQLDENNRAFVSVPWTDTITPEYDDSAIQRDIASERQRIDTLIQNLDASIKEKVEDLLEDAQWVEDNLTEGQVGGQSTDTVEELLKTYGVWNWVDPNDHSKGKTYNITKLQADVLGISAYTGDITSNTAALANLDIKINGEYTLVVEAAGTDTSGAIEISTISTEIAGLESVADGDTFRTKSFDTIPASNAIYKKGSTYFHFVKSNNLVDSNTTLTDSISQYGDNFDKLVKMAASTLGLKTSKNGNLLTTMADLASVITTTPNQTTGSYFTGYSGLSTKVEELSDGMSAHSSLLSTITKSTDPDDADYGKLSDSLMAGIASDINVSGAISTAQTNLISSINDKSAGITVMVTKDSSTGVVDSGITLKADQVTIDANQTKFKSAVGSFIKTDVLETGVADIKARLTVGGSDPAGSGTPGTITMKDASDGTIGIWDKDKLAVGTTSSPSSSNSAMLVNADGSGSLSKGNISWNTNGDVSVNGTGQFNGDVYANQFRAGGTSSFNITVESDAINFNYGNTKQAWFSTKKLEMNSNGEIVDTGNDAPQGFYLYMISPRTGNLVTIDFESGKFIEVTNGSVSVHTDRTTVKEISAGSNGQAIITDTTIYYATDTSGATPVNTYYWDSELQNQITGNLDYSVGNVDHHFYIVAADKYVIVSENNGQGVPGYTLRRVTIYQRAKYDSTAHRIVGYNNSVANDNKVYVVDKGTLNAPNKYFLVVSESTTTPLTNAGVLMEGTSTTLSDMPSNMKLSSNNNTQVQVYVAAISAGGSIPSPSNSVSIFTPGTGASSAVMTMTNYTVTTS